MLIKFAHGDYKRAFKQHRGEDSITVFCKTLKHEVERVMRRKRREMKPLTGEKKEQ